MKTQKYGNYTAHFELAEGTWSWVLMDDDRYVLASGCERCLNDARRAARAAA